MRLYDVFASCDILSVHVLYILKFHIAQQGKARGLGMKCCMGINIALAADIIFFVRFARLASKARDGLQ